METASLFMLRSKRINNVVVVQVEQASIPTHGLVPVLNCQLPFCGCVSRLLHKKRVFRGCAHICDEMSLQMHQLEPLLSQ